MNLQTMLEKSLSLGLEITDMYFDPLVLVTKGMQEQQPTVLECIRLLHKEQAHVAVETSGYARSEVFQAVANAADLVIMDLKLMDPDLHLLYTGRDNALILQNAAWLKDSERPHLFRTPLIPRITDTEENRNAIQDFIGNSSWETIPYNPLAGAKYPYLGMKYEIDEGEQ